MTITRLGYEKVIEAFKEKLDEREEERTKLKKYHEGNDLYNTDLMACKNKKKTLFEFNPRKKHQAKRKSRNQTLLSAKSTSLNPMVKSDLVTYRGVTIPFLFLQATFCPPNNRNNKLLIVPFQMVHLICRYFIVLYYIIYIIWIKQYNGLLTVLWYTNFRTFGKQK